MVADTVVEYSIPVERKDLVHDKTYYGWLVKAKEVGWFFSTDDKWATETKIIKNK